MFNSSICFFQKKKVFICHGPYPIVRAVLRKRGYVEKHYKGNLLPSKNKKNDSDGSDDDDSCDSGDDSDNETSPRKNTKISGNLPAKSRRASKTKTRTVVNVSKNNNDNDDDDGSGCDDSDNDSTDNEDWNAGYEGNGPDCEFSLMVSKSYSFIY